MQHHDSREKYQSLDRLQRPRDVHHSERQSVSIKRPVLHRGTCAAAAATARRGLLRRRAGLLPGERACSRHHCALYAELGRLCLEQPERAVFFYFICCDADERRAGRRGQARRPAAAALSLLVSS